MMSVPLVKRYHFGLSPKNHNKINNGSQSHSHVKIFSKTKDEGCGGWMRGGRNGVGRTEWEKGSGGTEVIRQSSQSVGILKYKRFAKRFIFWKFIREFQLLIFFFSNLNGYFFGIFIFSKYPHFDCFAVITWCINAFMIDIALMTSDFHLFPLISTHFHSVPHIPTRFHSFS